MNFFKSTRFSTFSAFFGLVILSGCQTVDVPDPKYNWFSSNRMFGGFNVPSASNVPVSSVSGGVQAGNFRRSAERWVLNCSAGDIIIEHASFTVYDRQAFDSVKDETKFIKRFEKRLPTPDTPYRIEKIDQIGPLAVGHIASFENLEGERCQHGLVIMRARDKRIDEWDSGFVDTLVDIDYCGTPALDIRSLIENLKLASEIQPRDIPSENWSPAQCPSIARHFDFEKPLDTKSFAKMSLIWNGKSVENEVRVVEFNSNKREGLFKFANHENILCSGTYQSATDFPVVQGNWSVICDDGNSAIGEFATSKPGVIIGIGYDANGRVTRFELTNFVLKKNDLKLSENNVK
ncbi:hypothetical protein HED22_17610 [Thalassospira sp. HF15]|uniref:hypothetical protein n=1 Tax=Thalassospira sp. HF15 TaxID=2722755 RepID=UPI00143016A6|nr:hypothetical protein [Thalassospira sp. HF15]NIY77470.1 hypothetical protein [Thalassospira sp. HF15]